MRAGKLDRTITIERVTTTVNEFGTPGETWTEHLVLRAQVIRQSTEEFIRNAMGASSEEAVVFRTRFADVTLADRLIFDGDVFTIKELRPLGRDRGLDIRVVRFGPAS
ncbi:MAG: phage head closure protein [Thermoanaerobaculia bacterium]